MPSEGVNRNAIAAQVREAMAHGWRVELVLSSGALMPGRPTRIDEDLTRRSDVMKAGKDHSHLVVVLDGHTPVALDRVREVRPAI